MKESLFFSVYEHTFVLKDNLLISRKFIVLKDSSKHIVKWTDFHKYIRSNSTKHAKKITDDSNQRFYYVVKLLNFAFFEKYHIKCLTDMSIDIVKDFLNAYGMWTLPDDVQVRSESTVNLCIKVIIDFLICLYDANKKTCCFKKTDLFKTIEVRNIRKIKFSVFIRIMFIFCPKPPKFFSVIQLSETNISFEQILVFPID